LGNDSADGTCRISLELGQVLVVDDEEDVREIVQQVLESGGVRVISASSGEEALELCEKNKFDLVVTDLNMPRMGGTGLIRIIADKYPDIAIIILSAYDDIEAARLAIRAGVSAYILKPFDAQELISTATQALDNIKVRREREMLYDEVALKYRELKLAETAREAVIRMMTDELRSPLGLVRTSLDTLAGKFAGPLTDEQLAIVESALAACSRAFRLVDEMLSAKMLKEGALFIDTSPVDLPKLVEDAADKLMNDAQKLNIDIRKDLPAGLPRVQGDGGIVRHILGKMLLGSIENASSWVSLSCYRSANGRTLTVVMTNDTHMDGVLKNADEDVVFGDSMSQLAAEAMGGKFAISVDGSERSLRLRVIEDGEENKGGK